MPAAILEASGSKDLLLVLEMDMMDFIYVPDFAAKVIQQRDKRKAPKGKGVRLGGPGTTTFFPGLGFKDHTTIGGVGELGPGLM